MRSFWLLTATVLLLSFGVLRLFETSAIEWLRAAAAPYALLELPFFFSGVLLWVYGWFERPRIALLVAVLATVGFWMVAGGF